MHHLLSFIFRFFGGNKSLTFLYDVHLCVHMIFECVCGCGLSDEWPLQPQSEDDDDDDEAGRGKRRIR